MKGKKPVAKVKRDRVAEQLAKIKPLEPGDEYVNRKEAADELGLSEKTLRNTCSRGPAFEKYGPHVRYRMFVLHAHRAAQSHQE